MVDEGKRVFEVMALPSPENMLWVADECSICIGDYGWGNDVSGILIHLTGYAKTGGTVWYARGASSFVTFGSFSGTYAVI
jgi:hypothetical protein